MRARNIVILLIILAMLGGVFYIYTRQTAVPAKPTEYVWLIDDSDITHITIEMPRQTQYPPESFIKIPHESDFPWFFDDANRTPVNQQKWGGGIPLLLSGPAANRVIDSAATVEKLTEYGILPTPQIRITLLLTDNTTMTIEVGDKTPNVANFYVKAPGTNQVAIVDYTWYDVISGIVTDTAAYVGTGSTATPTTAK